MNSKTAFLLKGGKKHIGCQLRKCLPSSFLSYVFSGVSHVIYSIRKAGKQHEVNKSFVFQNVNKPMASMYRGWGKFHIS